MWKNIDIFRYKIQEKIKDKKMTNGMHKNVYILYEGIFCMKKIKIKN